MVAGTQGYTLEVAGRYLNILSDKHSGTTNVISTRPSKVVANGVGVPRLGQQVPHVSGNL